MIEAVDAAVDGGNLMLKWPNDLLLDGAKLAGILLERQGDRVIAGFGVNLAVAPDVSERRTAHLGGSISPSAFAPLVAASFARILEMLAILGAAGLCDGVACPRPPVGKPARGA